jgi:hypothetical protein
LRRLTVIIPNIPSASHVLSSSLSLLPWTHDNSLNIPGVNCPRRTRTIIILTSTKATSSNMRLPSLCNFDHTQHDITSPHATTNSVAKTDNHLERSCCVGCAKIFTSKPTPLAGVCSAASSDSVSLLQSKHLRPAKISRVQRATSARHRLAPLSCTKYCSGIPIPPKRIHCQIIWYRLRICDNRNRNLPPLISMIERNDTCDLYNLAHNFDGSFSR